MKWNTLCAMDWKRTFVEGGGGVRVGAWCGSRLVNVQFNIKLATSVTAGRG